MGLIWGNGAGELIQVPSSISVTGIRVGSGEWWNFIFILPSLFSVILLLFLLDPTRKTITILQWYSDERKKRYAAL
jgi:hypothetical protein